MFVTSLEKKSLLDEGQLRQATFLEPISIFSEAPIMVSISQIRSVVKKLPSKTPF